MKNYYEILQVDRNASTEIIKKVFKIHIKKEHPDLFEGEEKIQAEERMKVLNEAYETLSDEQKRKVYDFGLEEEKMQNDGLTEINSILEQENTLLKRSLEEKENIISKFLGNLDLSEYTQTQTRTRLKQF